MNDIVTSDKESLKKARVDSSVKPVSFTIERVKKHLDVDNAFLVRLRVFVVSISAILSVIAISNIDLLNIDGFLYLETAEMFLSGGFSAAFSNYNWPYFSIVSALFSKFSGLSIVHSFYALSIIFFSIIAYAYIRICELRFINRKALLCAAIVFICAATVNDYRDQIIRGHGYWAFSLLGIYYLVYAISINSLRYLLLSILTISVSVLFRVEGFINILLFPFIYLYFSKTARRTVDKNKASLAIVVVTLTVTAVAGIVFFDDGWKLLSDIKHYVNLDSYLDRLTYQGAIVHKQITPYAKQEYAIPFVLTGTASIFLMSIMSCVGLAYMVSAILCYKEFCYWLKINKSISLVLLVLLLPLIVFTFNRYFLSTRYATMLSITLLIPISYVFYQAFCVNRSKVVKFVFAFLLVYSGADGLVSFNSTDKSYYVEAADWIKKHAKDGSVVVTNDRRLNYLVNKVYSKAPYFSLKSIGSISADVMVLSLKKRDKDADLAISKSNRWMKAIEFVNNKKDRVVVYKRIT